MIIGDRLREMRELKKLSQGDIENLLKKRSADDVLWGSVGKDARFLSKLRRLLSETAEDDRKLILHMAQRMARPKARPTATGD